MIAQHLLRSSILAVLLIGARGRTLNADAPNSAQLKAMIQIDTDNETPRKALEIARQTGDDSIMLAAMNNHNPDVKLRAIEAMADLPHDKAKSALIIVLSDGKLWSQRLIMGSEAITAQNFLTRAYCASVLKVFGIDITDRDLFDSSQRTKLIGDMKAK